MIVENEGKDLFISFGSRELDQLCKETGPVVREIVPVARDSFFEGRMERAVEWESVLPDRIIGREEMMLTPSTWQRMLKYAKSNAPALVQRLNQGIEQLLPEDSRVRSGGDINLYTSLEGSAYSSSVRWDHKWTAVLLHFLDDPIALVEFESAERTRAYRIGDRDLRPVARIWGKDAEWVYSYRGRSWTPWDEHPAFEDIPFTTRKEQAEKRAERSPCLHVQDQKMILYPHKTELFLEFCG